MKTQEKSKMNGWAIVMVILVLLAVAAGIGWTFLSKEHEEAKNLPLNAVNFNRLTDGTYTGEYAGGMYKWRANTAKVTVTGGKVTRIESLQSLEAQKPEFTQMLYDRVIAAQSLQVDTISGATLTSKAYLQSVENALVQAQLQ
jgi:uncharacterized protein with FMN-binding domain